MRYFGFAIGDSLQWGRGLLAAEMKVVISLAWEQAMLQWGRGLLAAEMKLASHLHVLGSTASMGPRLISRGDGEDPITFPTGCASMGPRLISRGDLFFERNTMRQTGFNGAAAY